MRQEVSSGTHCEATVWYSRAVRVGRHVFVSGTTASDENGQTMFDGDDYQQATFIMAKIAAALAEVGATAADVTRTRMFVTDISQWEKVGRADLEHEVIRRNVSLEDWRRSQSIHVY